MTSVRRRTSDNPRGCQNTNPSLSIIYRDIDELQANPENPRLHSKKQIKQIARSIEDFGFNVPFLVDRNLRLIAGHGRAEALKLLGIRKVPTICLEHLSESKARAFTIADNRLTEIATWDDHKLAEQFKTLAEITLDFSLESTGFEMGEIDVIMEGLTPALSKEKDPADELPEVDSEFRVTEATDLWLLGRSRVVCGDALDERTYSLLMEGRRAACVFIDPPYNDPIDGYGIEAARKANGNSGVPHTITHLQLIRPEDIPRFHKLGVIASFQLYWANAETDTIELVKPHIDPALYEWQYPARSVLDEGGMIAGASDWPVSTANVFRAIYQAETRTGPEGVLDARQRVPREAMLYAYTRNAARALDEQDRIGSIAPGKQADFALLDRDVLTVTAEEARETKVLWTVVGGKTVYGAQP